MGKAVLQRPSCVHYWCGKDGRRGRIHYPQLVCEHTNSDSNWGSTFNTPAGDYWDGVMLSNPGNVTVLFQELKNYV